MRMPFLLLLVTLSVLPAQAMAASQIAPQDGLWLSLPPDSVRCILIRLPWDAGITEPGNYVFSVSCTPGPQETWSDLSEQLVREVHENNTVEIPICFDTAGNKLVGNCSVPYTITVREEVTDTEKSWSGGICVSERGDIDVVTAAESVTSGDDVSEILNDNTDIFSAWLQEETVYAMPGETAEFNLSVQSHAYLELEVSLQGSLMASPGSAILLTGPGRQLQYQEFNLTAPSVEGTYSMSMVVSPSSCRGESYCTKTIYARLVVGEEPEESGFEVTLRPDNIDVKEPEGVITTLTIINNDAEPAEFTSVVRTDPDDAESTFRGETIEVAAHGSHTRIFVVTPGTSSELYEVTARVESGSVVRSATSFITIDEMVTDALRQSEGLDQSEVTEWINDHESSEYGSDLDEYGELRESLAQATNQSQQAQQPDAGNASDEWEEYVEYYNSLDTGDDADFTWIILVTVVAACGVVAFLLFRRRGSGPAVEGDVQYY